MADSIILDGDTVTFMPDFDSSVVTVVVRPGPISASSTKTKANKKPVCLVGDESQVEVPGCAYIKKPSFVGGMGTLKIDALAADQKSTKTKVEGKALILKGSKFTAIFEVTSPAQMPGVPPTVDSTKKYMGEGKFSTNNQTVKAS